MAKFIAVALALFAAQATIAALPSESRPVRGGLTILAHNTLENVTSSGPGAILIDHAQNYYAAKEACGQLSESLWVGQGASSFSSLNTSLTYQAYQRNYAFHAKFWVAREDDSCKCRAIGIDGSLHNLHCSEHLPVLCSQSAPVSNATFEDTSPDLQITQEVGESQITGYRDFFAWKFRGIRYAPTPRRFEYSSTLRNTSGPISALQAGADCLQRDSPDSSEDCLFLNIWTPFLRSTSRSASSSKVALKPVLFYIFGGNFVAGSSKNPNLDLTNIASRGDVVAVSINHRVGNLGMLVFSDGVHNGNVAISDQISALRWVKENISAFGGDPDRITIAGESSGAMSVRYLLSSPEAKGLYAGALMQSDGNGGLLEPNGIFWSLEQSYTFFTTRVLQEVGCQDAQDEVACLRDVAGDRLANLDPDTATAKYPVVDGKYLPTSSLLLDGSGPRYARDIPLLTGVTRDEAAIFDFLQAVPWSNVTFDLWTMVLYQSRDFFRLDPEAVLDNLPLFGVGPESTSTQLFNATVNILTHNMYSCLDRAKAYSGAKNGVLEKVYSFNFHRTYSPSLYTSSDCQAPASLEHPAGDPAKNYYRCHGGSQLTMFGNYERVGLPDRDGLDQDFSRLIVDYWSSFVRTGDPNPDREYLLARGYTSTLEQVEGVGKWEQVNPDNPEWMILEWDGSMAPFGGVEECSVLGQPLDYWEA